MGKRTELGYLGEPMSARQIKAFALDERNRRRYAVLAGVGLGVLLLWSQLALMAAWAQ